MGTRGAFGVIIGEQEKIGYNQFDSYPDGKGVDNLRWLRESIAEGELENLRELAEKARVVGDDDPIKATDRKALKRTTNAGVSTGDDWYALTRETHGEIGDMLQIGYIYDSHLFPLDSLFCEWAYLVDFDTEMFEVYEGFQKELPTAGRWAGRPTAEEDHAAYVAHLERCVKEKRDAWMTEVSEYKAVELVASWPFAALPSDELFLAWAQNLSDQRSAEYEAAEA